MHEEIKQVMAATWGISAESIPDDATLNTTPKWDSLGHMELMLAIEERFKVHMTTNDVLDMSTLGDIAEFLERCPRT